MITKFDSLYAGHVDMEDTGYAGTAVNDRSYSDEHLASALDKAAAIAQVLDRNGYDTFWMAEHHFQTEGYECLPNLLLLNVHLAHLTKNIKLGCAFNIAPMWHPLRLAEDFAMADILTGGRVIFGIGRGYHTREVETFGQPLLDQAANRDLFEEQAEIIFKSFNERSFSHHGKNYDIPPNITYRGYQLEEITLVPRPITRPVECWQPIQGGTSRALDFMAKHSIKGIIGGGVAEGGAMDEVMVAYQEALIRAGRTDVKLGEDISLGFHFYLAKSQEEAIKASSSYYEENLKMFGPLRLTRGMTEQQILDISDPKKAPTAGLPTMEDAVKSGSFLCGTPDQIIETLKRVEERYPGLDRVGMSHPVGTPEKVILEQLEWLARDVMPAFKGKVKAAVPADD